MVVRGCGGDSDGGHVCVCEEFFTDGPNFFVTLGPRFSITSVCFYTILLFSYKTKTLILNINSHF